MKTLLVVCLAILSTCLFGNPALADICTVVEQKTDFDLNEAECYVLEQVEKGEVAHFKVAEGKMGEDFKERFTKIEDRTLGADFFKDLLAGTIPNLKVTEKGVRIRNAGIKEPLILRNTILPFTLSLSFCIFDKEVDFSKVRFDKRADFIATTFSGLASFNGAKFSGKASFYGATFSGETSFDVTKFSGETSFNGAKFSGVATFSWATFSEEAFFLETKFSEETSFYQATFSGWASFNGTKFSGEASFIGTTFSSKASFNWTTFFRQADFSQVTFLKEIDFSLCDFTSKSHFKNALFHDTVIFDDVSGFSNMIIEWKYDPEKFDKEKDGKNIIKRGLKNKLKYNETFYIALIKNYRDMGWFTEADNCYYTYRVDKRKHRLGKLLSQDRGGDTNSSSSGSWWSKPMLYLEWLFLDRTFGYGVKPLKLLKTYLFLWLLFIPIYVAFLRLQYQYGKRKLYVNLFHKILRSTVHSVDTLTPGINLYAFTTLTPYYFATTGYRKTLLNIVVRFQQLSGWYLAALFLILFSRVWIR